jgi:two-component system response regulator YesN
MAYTILLVDDESAVREGIRARTPWATYGFSVIGEAGNGIEALELVEELRPDVVITDIRMPYLDGIELIQQIKQTHPTTTLVILSGYDEFTYAQQAMRWGVTEYVLKPVSVEDLSHLLARLSTILDEEIRRSKDEDRLKVAYRQALPLIREKFLVALLSGNHPVNDASLISKASEYGLDLDRDEFLVALVETDHSNEDPLRNLAMLEVVEEALSDDDGAIPFLLEREIVIIFTAKSHGQNHYDSVFRKQVNRKAEQIQAFLKKFSFEAIIGLGALVHAPSSISQSYRQALSALNYSSVYPDRDLLYISDLEHIGSEELQRKLEELKANVILAVKIGTEEQVNASLNELFGQQFASSTLEAVQALLLSLASLLQELASSYGHSLFSITEEEGLNLFGELATLTTLGKAKRWFTRLCLSLRDLLAGSRQASHIQFITEAKNLMARHFDEPGFGLEEICEMIGISPSYFSSTFKREVGVSFVQYLTTLRMDRAKELLAKTESKTYEIAEAVGYTEPNYFSFSFKRHVGLSPSQYRQAQR